MIKTLENLKEQLGTYRQAFRVLDFRKSEDPSAYLVKLRKVLQDHTLDNYLMRPSKFTIVRRRPWLDLGRYFTILVDDREEKVPSADEQQALTDMIDFVSGLATMIVNGFVSLSKVETEWLYDVGYSLAEYTDILGWDFIKLREGCRVTDALRSCCDDLSSWETAIDWLLYWIGRACDVCAGYRGGYGLLIYSYACVIMEGLW